MSKASPASSEAAGASESYRDHQQARASIFSRIFTPPKKSTTPKPPTHSTPRHTNRTLHTASSHHIQNQSTVQPPSNAPTPPHPITHPPKKKQCHPISTPAPAQQHPSSPPPSSSPSSSSQLLTSYPAPSTRAHSPTARTRGAGASGEYPTRTRVMEL